MSRRQPKKLSLREGNCAPIATTKSAMESRSGRAQKIDMPDSDGDAAADSAPRDVDHLTSDVLRRWRILLRRHADDRPRAGDRGESERLLVATLLRASNATDDAMLPALAAAAARYGTDQRRDRLDPGGLCHELAHLRQIVWSELRSDGSPLRDAVDRILRFDRALSIVVTAALKAGYSEK